MTGLARERLDRLAATFGEHRDIAEGRVIEPEPPAWCAARGWDGWLLALPEPTVAAAEATSLAHVIETLPGAPRPLRDLARAVRETTALAAPVSTATARALRRANERKRAQVAALAALARDRVDRARRVVDFGSGHGHLTRELASALGIEALGIERDAARVRVAEALSAPSRVRFVSSDALALSREDFAVGLHACGALGDTMIARVRDAGASALLVSCCLQKRPGAREPLSERGRSLGLTMDRALLGLGNLGDRYVGIEDDLDRVMANRRTRRALTLLLRSRGLTTAHGEEMQGLQRRSLSRGLGAVAAAATSLRGLAPPSDAELDEASRQAGDDRARIRRLSLPRNMLGRVVELLVAFDRACALEERGHEVDVLAAFDPAASPRNVALVAQPP